MTPNSHHTQSPRFFDNIFLTSSANNQYTGISGIVRQGLTHMAIPRGWTWGGPASEHCPIWFEIYTQKNLEITEVDSEQDSKESDQKIEIIFGDTIVNDVIKNGSCQNDKDKINVVNDICDNKNIGINKNEINSNNSIINNVLNNKKDILLSNGIVKSNLMLSTTTESNGKCCTDI